MFNIGIKKDIVQILTTENKKLKRENLQLRKTIDEISSYKDEYEKLINNLTKMRKEYQKKLDEFDKIEKKYKEEMNRLINR